MVKQSMAKRKFEWAAPRTDPEVMYTSYGLWNTKHPFGYYFEGKNLIA